MLDEEPVGHVGDWELLARVRAAAPALHVFGHCHGRQGARRGAGGVVFVNAASSDGRGGLAAPVVVDVAPAGRAEARTAVESL